MRQNSNKAGVVDLNDAGGVAHLVELPPAREEQDMAEAGNHAQRPQPMQQCPADGASHCVSDKSGKDNN